MAVVLTHYRWCRAIAGGAIVLAEVVLRQRTAAFFPTMISVPKNDTVSGLVAGVAGGTAGAPYTPITE